MNSKGPDRTGDPDSLPPLGEQACIVAKIESLLALYNALAAEEVRGRLLAAVLNRE